MDLGHRDHWSPVRPPSVVTYPGGVRRPPGGRSGHSWEAVGHVKYDDVAWHLGDDFPELLDDGAARTHMGIFLCWCLENDLLSDALTADAACSLLRDRRAPPSFLVTRSCEGKLLEEHLSETGNAFAREYYSSAADDPPYLRDYERVVRRLRLETMYHAPDDWTMYEHVRPAIDRAWQGWRRRHR